jgi:hypothetical protein
VLTGNQHGKIRGLIAAVRFDDFLALSSSFNLSSGPGLSFPTLISAAYIIDIATLFILQCQSSSSSAGCQVIKLKTGNITS